MLLTWGLVITLAFTVVIVSLWYIKCIMLFVSLEIMFRIISLVSGCWQFLELCAIYLDLNRHCVRAF